MTDSPHEPGRLSLSFLRFGTDAAARGGGVRCRLSLPARADCTWRWVHRGSRNSWFLSWTTLERAAPVTWNFRQKRSAIDRRAKKQHPRIPLEVGQHSARECE
ncbi:hypothetical protein SKAU_G00011120 [Synaphobranchus kaupii]|uniref:Uncharacterized protein n=1 Tax=Synaphobranchus kaupii TaxID=118154 RepID=A0A9Q1GB85_SYNKA|nr:hypothetical protein SKAU_G00011120 [Synaphobranchus kaupii]